MKTGYFFREYKAPGKFQHVQEKMGKAILKKNSRYSPGNTSGPVPVGAHAGLTG